jgi:hypothetical protein
MTDHRRQAIARNIGAVYGAEAFQVGETMQCYQHVLPVKWIGENMTRSETARWGISECGYTEDESFWSERQRLLIDSLCAKIGEVKV